MSLLLQSLIFTLDGILFIVNTISRSGGADSYSKLRIVFLKFCSHKVAGLVLHLWRLGYSHFDSHWAIAVPMGQANSSRERHKSGDVPPSSPGKDSQAFVFDKKPNKLVYQASGDDEDFLNTKVRKCAIGLRNLSSVWYRFMSECETIRTNEDPI